VAVSDRSGGARCRGTTDRTCSARALREQRAQAPQVGDDPSRRAQPGGEGGGSR
jgi:hypothetical protein